MQTIKYDWDLFEEETCLGRGDCQDENPLVDYTSGEPIYLCLDGSEELPAAYGNVHATAAMRLLDEFVFTRFSDIDEILQSRNNLPGVVERPDNFRREGESSEDWWERRTSMAMSNSWVPKRDGD